MLIFLRNVFLARNKSCSCWINFFWSFQRHQDAVVYKMHRSFTDAYTIVPFYLLFRVFPFCSCSLVVQFSAFKLRRLMKAMISGWKLWKERLSCFYFQGQEKVSWLNQFIIWSVYFWCALQFTECCSGFLTSKGLQPFGTLRQRGELNACDFCISCLLLLCCNSPAFTLTPAGNTWRIKLSRLWLALGSISRLAKHNNPLY